MPAIVSVKVVAARDLPVMDRSSELTDAFVEIRLGQNTQRTEVCKKTLNPVWDSPWLQFNTSVEELQDEPLTIKVMDYDQYSAHDAIGRVYLSLASLINPLSGTIPLEGWFPIYDTLHGVRGEIQIKVSIEVIKDHHKRSSNEILFFTGYSVPGCYSIIAEHGFIEELVVNIDPEYQWIDKIRPPRASNESRQQVFLKLSGELQRKIGRKALDTGGNAIIGYTQSFDLEGESGIVVRGIGTSATVVNVTPFIIPTSTSQVFHGESVERPADEEMCEVSGTTPPDNMIPLRPLKQTSLSDSDCGGPNSPTREVDVLGTSIGSSGGGGYMGGSAAVKATSEFPFYTLTSFSPGFIKNIAGVVSARSVKLLDDINNPDEPEIRDAWWYELRCEIRSHYRAMFCNAVIGYSETTSICDDLCILSATGTAAIISTDIAAGGATNKSTVQNVFETTLDTSDKDETNTSILIEDSHCGPCHTTYSPTLDIKLVTCQLCKVKQVPSVLLATVEPPSGILVRGESCYFQTRICKPKRRGKGEENASIISSMLPFIEYGLHSRLLNKLKLKGMNSLFHMKVQLTVGDTMIVGIITGTAMFLEALPQQTNFLIQDSVKDNQLLLGKLAKLQEDNRLLYQIDRPASVFANDMSGLASPAKQPSTPEAVEDTTSEFPLHAGKDVSMFVDIDEGFIKEEDVFELTTDYMPPQGFWSSSLSNIPGVMDRFSINQISRVVTLVTKQIIDNRQSSLSLDQQCTLIFNKMLQCVFFCLRKLRPCIVTNISFGVDLPDDDEMQVMVVALATNLSGDHDRTSGCVPQQHSKISFDDEVVFNMDNMVAASSSNRRGKQVSQSSSTSKDDTIYIVSPQNNLKEFQCTKQLGIINLFLIRETTSMKELGGMSSFLHTFVCEAHSIAHAQVLAIGGHALLGYQMRQCVVTEHLHKNQGQCLLNLTGNVIQLTMN